MIFVESLLRVSATLNALGVKKNVISTMYPWIMAGKRSKKMY